MVGLSGSEGGFRETQTICISSSEKNVRGKEHEMDILNMEKDLQVCIYSSLP